MHRQLLINLHLPLQTKTVTRFEGHLQHFFQTTTALTIKPSDDFFKHESMTW